MKPISDTIVTAMDLGLMLPKEEFHKVYNAYYKYVREFIDSHTLRITTIVETKLKDVINSGDEGRYQAFTALHAGECLAFHSRQMIEFSVRLRDYDPKVLPNTRTLTTDMERAYMADDFNSYVMNYTDTLFNEQPVCIHEFYNNDYPLLKNKKKSKCKV